MSRRTSVAGLVTARNYRALPAGGFIPDSHAETGPRNRDSRVRECSRMSPELPPLVASDRCFGAYGGGELLLQRRPVKVGVLPRHQAFFDCEDVVSVADDRP